MEELQHLCGGEFDTISSAADFFRQPPEFLLVALVALLDLAEHLLDFGERDASGVEAPKHLINRSFIFRLNGKVGYRLLVGIHEDVPQGSEVAPDQYFRWHVDRMGLPQSLEQAVLQLHLLTRVAGRANQLGQLQIPWIGWLVLIAEQESSFVRVIFVGLEQQVEVKRPAVKGVVQHGTQRLKSLLAVVDQELVCAPAAFLDLSCELARLVIVEKFSVRYLPRSLPKHEAANRITFHQRVEQQANVLFRFVAWSPDVLPLNVREIPTAVEVV